MSDFLYFREQVIVFPAQIMYDKKVLVKLYKFKKHVHEMSQNILRHIIARTFETIKTPYFSK